MKKYGHRGACAHAPENTLLSFRKALEFGVGGVEFDIQLSRDGEPMVIHDDTLNRTTNGKGAISKYSYAELQTFDAGGGEKIPHLRDVFECIDKRCELLIELKCDAVVAVDKIIREQVKTGWRYDQIWVLGFDHALLSKMHRLNPEVQICASFEGYPENIAQVKKETGASAIGPGHKVLDEDLIRTAHAADLKVITWTVNSRALIARAKAFGVDGIIGDYPERL